MMIDLDQLKADREAGTDGPWWGKSLNIHSENRCVARLDWKIRDEVDYYNGRRIARLPELEAAYIEVVAKLDKAVEALESPSMELLDACQEAANDYCEIDGDAGAWISSEGVEAILKTAIAAIKGPSHE